MKSGTKGYVQREINKRQVEREKLMAIYANRTSLLQMTIIELQALYGEENVDAMHPLFTAIQASANGSLIDLEKLTEDITEFNTAEVIDV